MAEKTTCKRCGLEKSSNDLTIAGECPYPPNNVLACRDREIAGLRVKVTELVKETAALVTNPWQLSKART